MLAILGTLVFFAVFGPSQAALSDEYQNSKHLDAKNASDYMLYWTYNKADSTISFAAKAKTTGWVGLGFTTKMDNTTTYDVVRGSYDVFAKKSEIYVCIYALSSIPLNIFNNYALNMHILVHCRFARRNENQVNHFMGQSVMSIFAKIPIALVIFKTFCG